MDKIKTIQKLHQILPQNWEARERLRNKGQFWTPEWVAEAMIAYLIADTTSIYDPAVGKGAFYMALKNLKSECRDKCIISSW
jgi:type I restriction-modification system DNA methylase subunit